MVNKVILIGNLGRDPEVRRFDGGSVVAKFSVATSESYKDKDGAWQDQTEWHDVVVWRDLAERAEKLLKKGSKVYVEGKLTHRKYTDSNNVERYITEVSAQTFRLLDKREGGGPGSAAAFPTPENEPSNARRPHDDGGSARAETSAPMPVEGDDLPF